MKNDDVISGEVRSIVQYCTPFCLDKDDVSHLPGHARFTPRMALGLRQDEG